MLLVVHAVPSPAWTPVQGLTGCGSCVPSPGGDLPGEGPVLPGPGLGPGTLLLLAAHPQEHHQAGLLLQPRGQSLGGHLHEVPLLRLR